jgi:2-keto-4-pentenoate hydratase
MGWTISPLSWRGSLSLDNAYAIQRQLTAIRLAEGERVVGWKLGYTSAAMREQMGVAAPNFAPLTDAMLLPDGADLGGRAVQPRVEPEIAVRLSRDLVGDVGLETVEAAVGDAYACLEVVDSIFTNYVFSLEDNTADGSSAAFVVLGGSLERKDRLDEVTVRHFRNGDPVADATGAAADGHPLAGVVWLAAQLAERGEGLERGQFVITGGLTRAVPLMPGDSVVASFQGRTTVSVRRS